MKKRNKKELDFVIIQSKKVAIGMAILITVLLILVNIIK